MRYIRFIIYKHEKNSFDRCTKIKLKILTFRYFTFTVLVEQRYIVNLDNYFILDFLYHICFHSSLNSLRIFGFKEINNLVSTLNKIVYKKKLNEFQIYSFLE